MNESSGIINVENKNIDMTNGKLCQFTELYCGSYCRIIKAKRNGQWWVLKCLKPECEKHLFYQGLLQKEYDILTRLNHPAIVKAIGMETVPEYGKCIVMEYIEGITLDNLKIGRKQRLRLVDQLLEVVSYIHSLQIVHRDLKPQNIIVTNNGQNLKIIDFGLADTDNYAILKQQAGTLSYMAPEQRQVAKPDMRNDVYSLGLILKDLHLGWQYGFVISRCLSLPKYRYAEASELKKAIGKCRQIPKWVLISFVMLIIIVEALWIGFGMKSKTITHNIRDSVIVVQHKTDSVMVVQHKTDTIIKMDNSLQQSREEIKKKIIEGREMIDKFWKENNFEKIMSCPIDSIMDYYFDKKMSMCNKVLVDFIEDSGLEPEQKSAVKSDLMQYNSKKYFTPYIERLYSLSK